MAELPLVRCHVYLCSTNAAPAELDWSGIASAAERRRIQNRINARAYRQRKARLRFESSLSRISWYGPQPIDKMGMGLPFSVKEPGCHSHCQTQDRSDSIVYRLSTGSPSTDTLLTLVALNLQRALIANMQIFGLEAMDCKTVSPFSKGVWSSLPRSFWPTPLQISENHHPLFDLMPDAQLRHQLILFQEAYGDGLYFDLVGLSKTPTCDLGGLSVWGEPHLVENWEISEGFYRKYYPIVRNCTKMIENSNRWRDLRGEEPLS